MGSISDKRHSSSNIQEREPSPFNVPLSHLLLYVGLGIISLMFAGFIFAYVYASFQKDLTLLRIPNIFHANTVIILSSSILLKASSLFLEKEEYREYAYSLLATLTLGIVFMLFQVIGWMELLDSGVSMKNSANGAYLYLISGLHLLHIIGGFIPLGFFTYKAFKLQSDLVHELIFTTDPGRFSKFKMLSLYWHFVGGLWLLIYFVFVVLNIAFH